MQVAKPPTFRPTFHMWAAQPGALPPVTVGPLTLAPDGIDWGEWDYSTVRQVNLPDDFAIREVLDSGDVFEFSQRWGLLVTPGDELRSFHSTAVDQVPASVAVAYPYGVYRVSASASEYALRTLRALAGWYVSAVEGDEQGMRTAWVGQGFNEPRSTATGARWWAERVNAALRAFPMRVDVDMGDGLAPISRSPSAVGLNTFEVAVLQLALIAAGGHPVLRCANERCGRPFTIQRTARRKYQGTEHASGVRYCSEQCAKAQSERDRRARRKAETGI